MATRRMDSRRLVRISIRGLKYPRAIARIQDLTPLRKSGILELGFLEMIPAAKVGVAPTGHGPSRTLLESFLPTWSGEHAAE